MSLDLLGQYYGEPSLTNYLNSIGINTPPKIARGEKDVVITALGSSVELTFSLEESLDVSFREYPDEAKVLANIFFHGVKTSDHEAFHSDLPESLSFSMTKTEVINALGTPAWINPRETLLRWNAEEYCISARFNGDKLIMVGIKLPNKYTMNTK